jgi:hypothetical protein
MTIQREEGKSKTNAKNVACVKKRATKPPPLLQTCEWSEAMKVVVVHDLGI